MLLATSGYKPAELQDCIPCNSKQELQSEVMFLFISKNDIYMCSQIPFYRRESTATLMYHLPNRCFLLCYFYCEELMCLQIGNRLGDRHI